MNDLRIEYKARRAQIKKRLNEFGQIYKCDDKDIFAELCFCILTPQSKAAVCDKAIEDLKESGVLFTGDRGSIRRKLYGVRFPNNKARYIVEARSFLKNGKQRS